MTESRHIAQGRTAHILVRDGRAIKLFFPGTAKSRVEEEYAIYQLVQKTGLPIPRAHGLIQLDSRWGIVMDYASGPTLLTKLLGTPDEAQNTAEKLAEIQVQIHRCRVDKLPLQKSRLEWAIGHTDLLPLDLKQKQLSRLAELAEGNILCHGDFHPDNIIWTAKGPVIIDWANATRGLPEVDAARTVLLLRWSAVPPELPTGMRREIEQMRQRLTEAYLQSFCRLSGLTRQDIEQWLPVVVAARFAEAVSPAEQETLLGFLANQKVGEEHE